MKKVGFQSQSGKSIIELLIVLVVGGILISMAVTSMGSAPNNLQRQNLAREFKVNLERARYDSVKRRAETTLDMARIRINDQTSYSVVTDLNQNGALNFSESGGVLTGTDVRQVSFAGRANVKILGAGFTFPVNIRFDRRGQITATDGSGNAITPIFYFCEGACTVETANVSNANIVVLSETGTVAMLNGGEPIPPYQSPTVTNVGIGNDINEWVAVSNENQVTPDPSPSGTPSATPVSSPSASPSATPSPSPTASASPSPTASQTPTPTPTPTPVINYCVKGEKPADTGCTCKLPFTVRSSGKCM